MRTVRANSQRSCHFAGSGDEPSPALVGNGKHNTGTGAPDPNFSGRADKGRPGPWHWEPIVHDPPPVTPGLVKSKIVLGRATHKAAPSVPSLCNAVGPLLGTLHLVPQPQPIEGTGIPSDGSPRQPIATAHVERRRARQIQSWFGPECWDCAGTGTAALCLSPILHFLRGPPLVGRLNPKSPVILLTLRTAGSRVVRRSQACCGERVP